MIRKIIASIIAALLPLSISSQHIPQELIERSKEYECLAIALHHEARGEPRRGMIAVANVIMNRVEHPKFPDSICAVVLERTKRVCQFSWRCKPNWNRVRLSPEARDIAFEIVMLGQEPRDHTRGALFFHSLDKTPWQGVIRTVSIGKHHFYKLRS